MESMSIPPHGRRNPYDDVFLSTGPERETLEAHEYAEIFSGSSSIPVLDLSGLVGPGVSRASKLDYSNIFRGELFNGSAQKALPRKQPDEGVFLQESDSLHSSGNPEIPSGEAFGHTVDEPKKQFNVSFDRTNQRNIRASNEKPHVAKLQIVPGFTHIVDSTPCLLKKDNGRTIDSMKRKVSCSQPSASCFVPKNDALEKNEDEFTSPYNGEDIEDNSIAAALKRAIDQAQESIRLAKMIMDRKREGYQNGSKARQKGHLKVSCREGEMNRDSKKNNFEEKSAELNLSIFNDGIDGKSTPSLIYDNAYISAAKVELESVCENAAEGKGSVLVLSGDGELFSSNDIQRESLYIDEQVELKMTKENVEQIEVSVDHARGLEVVAEEVERAFDASSQRIQELEMNVEEAGDCKATFDHAEGSENKVERVLNSPQRTRKQWKVLGEAFKYFGFSNEDGLSEETENDMDDKGKKEHGQVSNVECAMELDSTINGTCNSGGNEALGQVETERENHSRDEDEQNLPGEVEEKHMNTFECEVTDTIETDEKHCAQVQKGAAFFVSDENRNSCQNEDDAYVERINEAVDVNSSSSSSCDVDLDNDPKEYQTVVEDHKENYTVPKVNESCSEINDKEAEYLFHQEDENEIPGMETLCRISSEEIFVESKLHSDIDSLSSDGSKIEKVHVMGADPEEKLPEDEGASSTGEVDDVAQEFDTEDVEQASEDASGSDEGSVSTSIREIINGFSAYDSEECKENANETTPVNDDELKDEVDLVSNERIPEGKFMESEGAGGRDSDTANNKGSLAGTSLSEANVGDPQNNEKNDYQQRIDAIKRGREREKERKVVEKAIREARERAFAEARERAERASVEKASTEPRQRAMSEAREKVSRVKQPVVVDKVSTRAKLRAERAAVQKATAEARERALEKAMSLKTTHTEKVSGSSRNNGLKHSFSSSDLDNGTESAQRQKARLEKHQMIMERAEKALAEKNVRDVLAQKEQAEKNRLAESLDVDIKRWATGKEKNLRALLSTLQYILGSDSGWQPIPLTDIVTAAAVKKAYRKATLCVHPDKLQQRGATIKQKYICEKVFDLLKVAWNRFDSDERW